MFQEARSTHANGIGIALKSVRVEGRLDGLLADMTIAQHYRNDSGKTLEIVYTFPLARGGTLLGMSVTLGKRRLEAAIAGKAQAWERYEKAIEDGDTPILVDRSGPDLYTANLGNIGDGEEVTVRLRYAQLLSFDGPRLCLRVPCVVAPRYGDPHRDGGLAPHETVAASIAAEYPLTVEIALPKEMAAATIHCPGHDADIRNTGDGVIVAVESGATLDRDFVLVAEGLRNRSFFLSAPDIDGHMALASFHVSLPPAVPKPLRLKVLVDCSSAMAGDGVVQAAEALLAVMARLKDADRVALSRFGSGVEHVSGGFWDDPRTMLTGLAQAADALRADMGGMELERALLSTFRDVAAPEPDSVPPCVLLVTNGEVWKVAGAIAAARSSGHRIFAMGVGNAPAESLLRDLAESAGGACELVSPGEEIAPVVARLIGKMRGAGVESAAVDWGGATVWQSKLPSVLYHGDTVHAFASLVSEPLHAPALRARRWEAAAKITGSAHGDVVARLAGARRAADAVTMEEARDLALRYRFVGECTSLFLLHVRGSGKSGDLPDMHQIPHMVAAGEGGFGAVWRRRKWDAPPYSEDTALSRIPEAGEAPWRHSDSMSERTRLPRDVPADADDEMDIPCFMWRGDGSLDGLGAGPAPEPWPDAEFLSRNLLNVFENATQRGEDCVTAIRRLEKIFGTSVLGRIVRVIGKRVNLDPVQVWALLLDRLYERAEGDSPAVARARRLLWDEIASIPDATRSRVLKKARRELSFFGTDTGINI